MPRKRKPCPEKFSGLIYYILEKCPGINTHALMKIAYLIELDYKIHFGEKLTEIKIVRLPRGPAYAGERNLLERLEYYNIIQSKKLGRGYAYYPGEQKPNPLKLTDIERGIIDEKIKLAYLLYKKNPNIYWKKLIDITYKTPPMLRYQDYENKLGEEKMFGRELLKSPYFIKKKDCSPDLKENLKTRQIQRIKFETRINQQKRSEMRDKINELRRRLKVRISKQENIEIAPHSDEIRKLNELTKIQREVMKKVLRD